MEPRAEQRNNSEKTDPWGKPIKVGSEIRLSETGRELIKNLNGTTAFSENVNYRGRVLAIEGDTIKVKIDGLPKTLEIADPKMMIVE